MTALDLNFVRQQFPALTTGKFKDFAFFENAGGSYVPQQVLDHLDRYLIEAKVQPYGPYAMSEQGTFAIEQATIKMAEMINADQAEVMIGHSTTMNLYLLANALKTSLGQNAEIIVTNQDHESNISPWRRLESAGVKIIEWQLDPESGELLLSDLEKLLSNKTRLVCMTHSSNIVGSVNDVKSIADLVHNSGAKLLVDGVSYAPHHAIDVKALGVDIYVLSLYKLFGPHLGLMFVNADLHEQLENQSLAFMPELYKPIEKSGSPNFMRIALNPGYVNHESVASLLGLVDYFQLLEQHHYSQQSESFTATVSNVFQLIQTHETQLSTRLLNMVAEFPQFILIGQTIADSTLRSPTFSFQLKDYQAAALAKQLAEQKVAVQSGCFYAWRCLQAIGIDPNTGVLRISLAHFNTEDELRHLEAALQQIL